MLWRQFCSVNVSAKVLQGRACPAPGRPHLLKEGAEQGRLGEQTGQPQAAERLEVNLVEGGSEIVAPVPGPNSPKLSMTKRAAAVRKRATASRKSWI